MVDAAEDAVNVRYKVELKGASWIALQDPAFLRRDEGSACYSLGA